MQHADYEIDIIVYGHSLLVFKNGYGKLVTYSSEPCTFMG